MILTVLNSFTTLLAVLFITYVFLIIIPYLRHKPDPLGEPDHYQWHFFIPCRDEEAVIGHTMERARRDFPQAHVWVVDDDSTDATSEIVAARAADDPLVHLVQRRLPNARTGKGDALNAAYAALNGWLPENADRGSVIVCVVDADGEMADNALEVVAGPTIFGDPIVGAAQVAVWMKNRDDPEPLPGKGRVANGFARWLLRMQDMEFRTVISGMQSLRARTGTVGLGGNGQFTRLAVLDEIAKQFGEPWHGALLEDYELGVHVMLAGYRTRHVYDTHVSQEALPSARRLLTQRTRWSQGNIQCVRYLPHIFRSPHIDASGVLETCYYLLLPFMQVLGGMAYSVLLGWWIIGAVNNPAAFAAETTSNLWLLALVAVFGIGPFAIWGPVYKLRCEPQISWQRAVLYGFGMWIYVYYMYVCVFRAFLRVLRGKNTWSKTRRNAENPVSGAPVAIES